MNHHKMAKRHNKSAIFRDLRVEIAIAKKQRGSIESFAVSLSTCDTESDGGVSW